MKVLYEKEMADHIRSKRFLIVLCLILLTSIASVYGAVSTLPEALKEDSNEIFLKLFTLSGNSVPSFKTFIALLGPFVGLALGFDAINSERAEGTLNRLVSQPIYRDSIINAKFLAGASLIGYMVLAMGLLIGATGLIVTGIAPSADEIGRILIFLILTDLYIDFWLALSILMSVVSTHAATSAMTVIALWLFFALFMNMAVEMLSGLIWPVRTTTTANGLLMHYNGMLMLDRLNPYYLYSESVSTIMDPGVRAINLMLPQQLDGAITGYLSFGQSLLLIWPHVCGLLAYGAVLFAAAYILFMRKEIRSR